MYLTWFVCSVVAVAVLIGIYRHLALRSEWLDVPNHRSSHEVATPHGAGVIILLVYCVYLAYALLTGALGTALLPLFLTPVLVGVIGAIDDFHSVPSSLRLALYLCVVSVAVVLEIPLQSLDVGGWLLSSQWLLMPLTILAITWLINLYNFMDGINGIAGFEFLFVIGAVLWLAQGHTSSMDLSLLLGVAAAVVGFLLWNFPAGKVFLGDVGSTFLGCMLGILIVYSASHWQLSPWVWGILLGGFVVDTTFTLLTRLLRGDRWFDAHRSHLFQILSRRWGSHSRVVGALILANLFWFLPLAWLARDFPHFGLYLMALAYVPPVIACYRLGAGKDHG